MRGKDNLLGGVRGPLAVTGSGILSAAGRGMAPITRALDARASCLARRPAGPRGRGTGGLSGLVPDDAIPEPGRGGLGGAPGRSVRMAAAALRDALDRAWSGRAGGRPERVGAVLGSALGAVQDIELEAGRGGLTVADRVDELNFAVFGDRVTASAMGTGPADSSLRGSCSVFSATCVSGLCALEKAAADIALDRADAMAVGGIDTLSDVMLAGFTSLGIVTGSGRLRPFHGTDDGIAIGEAACFVVVEPLAEALRSGAPAACVLGQSLQSDGYHLTTPDPSGRGMARAIRRALEDAGLTADAIGGILVTAAGSPVYDRMLCRAVEEALGSRAREVPVSTWEPAVGHVLAATGVLALAFATEVLRRGRLPEVYPVRGDGGERDRAIDSDCRLDYVVDGPRELEEPVVLALVVGFGGQNGAVVLAGPERFPVRDRRPGVSAC